MTAIARPEPAVDRARARLTFGGILRSEWIKFASLASSIWCLAAIWVVTIGFGLLVAATIDAFGTSTSPVIMVATAGNSFTQLIVVVLGALMITREYGTGMIRSTFTAAPRRVSVLVGKALVLAVTVFLVTLLAILVTATIGAAVLGDRASFDAGDPETWRMLAGAGLSSALLALFGFGVGALLRNTAGGITAALGVLLVLPVVLQFVNLDWVRDAQAFLPLSAASAMYSTSFDPAAVPAEVLATMPLQLLPWQGLLVLVAWVAALLVPAGILVRTRDA